jgi:hypothetical protein
MSAPVVRVWQAYGSADGVQRYCNEYFAPVLLPRLRARPGFRGARLLIRSLGAQTQLVVETEWDSMQAVMAFAGEESERAVVEPIVSELLTHFDDTVTHYTLVLG